MDIINEITREVASETGESPSELPPLYHTIDTDALDRVLESLPDDAGYIVFSYANCRVTVDADGTITVD